MFENLLHQNASALLSRDVLAGTLPDALLFAGPASSGKLTCALELSRILSCAGAEKGRWLCGCDPCRLSKELISRNMMLLGPRDCLLEIRAAKRAFLEAAYNNAPFLKATQYLFIRSVRKLTLRFSPILWEDDDKLPKISPFLQAIDEGIDAMLPEKALPGNDSLSALCDGITAQCQKLSGSFMYDAVPIGQIRSASGWARLTAAGGKKVIILENVERMNEGARNALLKILEEPPSGAMFVLTTTRRGAVMQTMLSRVRTYPFCERGAREQAEVLSRVFHVDGAGLTVDSHLQSFLPVSRDEVFSVARAYAEEIRAGGIPSAADVVKSCAGFEPKSLLRLFLLGVQEAFSDVSCAQCAEFSARNAAALRDCYSGVAAYNQSAVAAIERLTRDVAANRRACFG